ncbi:helix-turn-helix domain-containing protein [Hymenobacter weizhouensis]|uniref:helix-turn-helix domain-containing protein n=1 Tax=Hymenobacter sp. YIM 151500-1 TaxID=2987689 RepID=UPI0022265E24|nr:helix-turn-helix domain-containing protein [Hymenobacter sp. YIM 151500-1]UYZ62228.1 helix-turn-helix domain-containing protein [Hymenobacter sp. YIM 151500-1]
MPHQGEILQEAIKNSGISITRIVEELGITRPTIYRKFKDETLDASFVKRVGEIIQHDFSHDFTLPLQAVIPFTVSNTVSHVTNHTERVTNTRTPVSSNTEADSLKQLMLLQQKYIALLEAYNELLLKVYGPK